MNIIKHAFAVEVLVPDSLKASILNELNLAAKK